MNKEKFYDGEASVEKYREAIIRIILDMNNGFNIFRVYKYTLSKYNVEKTKYKTEGKIYGKS